MIWLDEEFFRILSLDLEKLRSLDFFFIIIPGIISEL